MTITKLLKVSSPEGKRVEVKVRRNLDNVLITADYNKLVEADNPPFAKKGIIVIKVERDKYQATIATLTDYFETLFLKGLTNESMDPSPRAINDTRRDEKTDSKSYVGLDKGKGSDSSVHIGSRGQKHTKSFGGAKSSPKVDKVSDTSFNSEDKTRD